MLFRQPESSHLGDCPICWLPLPLGKTTINTCCSKVICDGCSYANTLRADEEYLEETCPFCRQTVPKTVEEADQNRMKRVKTNDPVALHQRGIRLAKEEDYKGAIEYFTRAAALGDLAAHYDLSFMYKWGEGVAKDMKKAVYHMEEASIGGHPDARFNLGRVEEENGRPERAVKHYIIAAKLGDEVALETVKEYFTKGMVRKEDYEVALRGYQAAVDATKSKQREEAYAYYKD